MASITSLCTMSVLMHMPRKEKRDESEKRRELRLLNQYCRMEKPLKTSHTNVFAGVTIEFFRLKWFEFAFILILRSEMPFSYAFFVLSLYVSIRFILLAQSTQFFIFTACTLGSTVTGVYGRVKKQNIWKEWRKNTFRTWHIPFTSNFFLSFCCCCYFFLVFSSMHYSAK